MKNINITKYSLRKKNLYTEIASDFFLLTIITLFIFIGLKTYVFETVIVEGVSMEETFTDRDILILDKLSYRFSEPQRGDIIVLEIQSGSSVFLQILSNLNIIKEEEELTHGVFYIKRIIAIPGDTLEIKDNNVFINNAAIHEPYIMGNTHHKGYDFPYTLSENEYFVMGDNRENSRDSRNIGPIEYEKILGKIINYRK